MSTAFYACCLKFTISFFFFAEKVYKCSFWKEWIVEVLICATINF